MKVLGVIPARLYSTRLPEKLIRKICDKYILEHVWERVNKAKSLTNVVIATDHEKVRDICKSFGANVVMTKDTHRSGTDRLVEVAKEENCSVVVNIQGDEPLIQHTSIDKLVKPFTTDKSLQMATLCCHSEEKTKYLDPNVVKVVFDKDNYALYFSRHSLPFYRDCRSTAFYKHVGLYAYRRNFLLSIPKMKKSKLEDAEKLEQLRILENGHKIKVIEVKHDSIGVDTLEDLNAVEKILKKSM